MPEGWSEVGVPLLRLLIAFGLGLPIGWERESRDRTPGLRTFPLVSLGACAFLLIGEQAYGESIEAQSRVLQALLTGVGFIAGGAILKSKKDVTGIATAVGVWLTTAVGAATAVGAYLIAVLLTVATVITLHFPHSTNAEAEEE